MTTATPVQRVVFESCDICGSDELKRLPADWANGDAIPIVGCGNPWHYAVASLGDAKREGSEPE